VKLNTGITTFNNIKFYPYTWHAIFNMFDRTDLNHTGIRKMRAISSDESRSEIVPEGVRVKKLQDTIRKQCWGCPERHKSTLETDFDCRTKVLRG